jgi:AraC-like DNA-binding protein
MLALLDSTRRPAPTIPDEVAALHAACSAWGSGEGRHETPHPALCLYRFDAPTRFDKMPSFGVTLGIVLEGEKRVRVADHTVTVGAGQIVALTREVDFDSEITRVPYLGVSVHFAPQAVAEALVAIAEAGEPKVCVESVPAFVTEGDPRIVDALRRLVTSLHDPVERRMLAPLAESELLFHLLRSPAAAALRHAVGPRVDRARILDAMRFIRENAARPLSVEQIARRVAMSPSHFAHRFRDVARTSPMRYLREVRLDAARRLLLEGQRAGAVATEVGFESPSHFTREFKRRFGKPPSAFRASHEHA